MFLFVPDLFTPYLQGREMGIDRNWKDLNQYNQVQKGQFDNYFNFNTLAPRINSEYAKADAQELANMLMEQMFPINVMKGLYDLQDTIRLNQINSNPYAFGMPGMPNPLMGWSTGSLAQAAAGQTPSTNQGQQAPPLPSGASANPAAYNNVPKPGTPEFVGPMLPPVYDPNGYVPPNQR